MTNPIPDELQAKISAWRRKAADDSLSIEEMKEAIVHLRAGRISAATASKSGKKKSVAPPADELMKELLGDL